MGGRGWLYSYMMTWQPWGEARRRTRREEDCTRSRCEQGWERRKATLQALDSTGPDWTEYCRARDRRGKVKKGQRYLGKTGKLGMRAWRRISSSCA